MDAKTYNKRAEGRYWLHHLLPSTLVEHATGSEAFADSVRYLQNEYGLEPVDGKLGPGTVDVLERILNIRMNLDPVGWLGSAAGIKVDVYPTKRKEPKRKSYALFLIIHTTGSGIYNYAKKYGLSPFEGAVKYYTSLNAYSSHFLAGREEGQLCQNVPINEIGYHAGVGEQGRNLYHSGQWPEYVWPVSGEGPKKLSKEESKDHYDWWFEQWGNKFSNPLQLTLGDPNGRSVGFDFLAYPYKGEYTDWQYKCLAAICIEMNKFGGLILDRRHILTHSDTHPITRCNKNGGWDPGPKFSYAKLWAKISELQG